MYISNESAKREDWDQVKSWNYKLPNTNPKMSVVYAEVAGEHGEVTTKNLEWIYYIIDGESYFIIDGKNQSVKKGDVIIVPAHTPYNYYGNELRPLKVVMVIDFWDN